MPLEVASRCIDCHQLKLRSEFPTRIVGKSAKTKRSKRIWLPYCKECERVRYTTGRNPDAEPPDKFLER